MLVFVSSFKDSGYNTLQSMKLGGISHGMYLICISVETIIV